MSKNNKVLLTVYSKPEHVEFECPHCEEDIEIAYDEFEKMIGSDYWGDWQYNEFICPNCGGYIGVEEIDSRD